MTTTTSATKAWFPVAPSVLTPLPRIADDATAVEVRVTDDGWAVVEHRADGSETTIGRASADDAGLGAAMCFALAAAGIARIMPYEVDEWIIDDEGNLL